MFEYLIILFFIILLIIIILKLQLIVKYKNICNNNIQKQKLIDIINNNIYDNNIIDKINNLLNLYYNNNGYILITRGKNDLIRDKKKKLHIQMCNIIRNLTDKQLIKQEIKKINREMILYTYELKIIISKVKYDFKVINIK